MTASYNDDPLDGYFTHGEKEARAASFKDEEVEFERLKVENERLDVLKTRKMADLRRQQNSLRDEIKLCKVELEDANTRIQLSKVCTDPDFPAAKMVEAAQLHRSTSQAHKHYHDSERRLLESEEIVKTIRKNLPLKKKRQKQVLAQHAKSLVLPVVSVLLIAYFTWYRYGLSDITILIGVAGEVLIQLLLVFAGVVLLSRAFIYQLNKHGYTGVVGALKLLTRIEILCAFGLGGAVLLSVVSLFQN